MRAVVQHGPEDLRLEELPVPSPGAGEVLARVRATGICGSDIHAWRHCMFGAGVVLGHEIAGEVVALGEGVYNLAVGQIGAVYAGGPCGSCDRCKAGLSHYCDQGIALGAGGGVGGFAEYVLTRADNFIPAPEGADPAAIAFSEPLANGLRGLDHLGEGEASTAVILGAGAIGLACLIAAKRAGVERAIVVEGRPRRRQAALDLGADQLLSPIGEEVGSDVRREFPHGPDLVVEAVGLPETINSSMDLVRPGGTVLLMGVYLGEVGVQPTQWVLKEMTIRASLGCSLENQIAAVKMISSKELDPEPLITRRGSLEEVPELLAELAEGADEVKTVVEYE
jgi:2-desacetyl-2-hydroxyethyl bacteriochlorophyllide A dehydrogenase